MDNTIEEQKYWLRRDFIADLLKQLPIYVFWKNKDCVYLGCNDAFARSLGLSSTAEVIGKTDYDLSTTKAESDAYRADDMDVMTSLKPKLNIEESQTLSDGRKIVLLTSKVPLLDQEKKVIGVLGIYSDITDRKKMEENLDEARKRAEASDNAKTEFLQNMQHDLRTPFSGILGLSELMESQETDPEKKENLGYIVESAKTLLDHLNEIFEFIKLESGRLPILEKSFDLQELLQDLLSMMKLAAKNKNIDFSLNIEEKVSHYVIGDKLRTQRILINLIANAIKFTDEGYVKVNISVAEQLERSVVISFLIKDTGIGIPEDKRDIIFERFNRLTSSYSGVYSGKGLGLRIVKQFLDEIGGESDLETTLGEGTTFKVSIPYKLPLTKN